MADQISVEVEETGPLGPGQTEEPQEESSGSTEEQSVAIPDKFMNTDGTVNVEALAKSYSELERSRNTTQETIKNNTNNTELKVSDEESERFSQEVMENGDLSEESYKSFEDKGIPRAMAEAYVEGQKALMAQAKETLMNPIGGEEVYRSMIEWAGTSLSEEEIASYDATMNEGDMNQKSLAVQGLFARFSATNPQSPSLIMGEAGPGVSTSSFESWAQVKAAMGDPQYQSDPAYREQVAQRLSMSNI